MQPGLNGPLLSFKTFMEMQSDNIDIAEAQKYYDDYRGEHQKKQSEIFFAMHRDEHWFREKYDPEQSYKWKAEQIAQSQSLARKFLE